MLTGNSFSRDSDSERTERLVLLSANIGDLAVELGFQTDKLGIMEHFGPLRKRIIHFSKTPSDGLSKLQYLASKLFL